ncbi:Hsp70 family protein [Glycomyces tritici]|uniref:Hsp70 family protein n=1 Tax=Glycomyces tritici TaxID=2665176 RepID=A0ABT7YTC2_9ACTN|nr:Hsp70 family protein [Glycomyces tritici]MDN3241882.1 Hsp70 family protein [Glycomyces tritici]
MSPGPQGTSLGVDFGTSHTIAVVRRADGSLRPLLFDGAPLMPSAVCADADGGILVGRDAVHAGRRHPERFEPNPKRLIDRPSTLLGAREYPISALIGAVLDAVAAECRRVVGQPSQVTLTVPAEWGPARRQVIEDAAARSGLGQVRLVPEPVAAATYYAEALKHRMAVGASIVVYDLGAGTFDASVVRRTEHGFSTVALDGRSDLGGLDIDAALIEHLGTTYGDREGWKRLVNPSTVEDRRHFREFQEEVRGAKERLSRHQQSDIAIPILDVEAHLTRTELEQIAHPHLEQTIRVTQAVIRAAGLDVAASAGVFLVGGASRMPLVGTMLHRSLGLAPTVLDQPEVVVAEGSVLWTQAGQYSTTFPLTRPAQQGGFVPAPFTPAVANLAPPSPQTAPAMQAPPQTAPTYQPVPSYTPSPRQEQTPPELRPAEPVTAESGAAEPSPVHRNLPPQTRTPQFTPPVSVDRDDDEDEPPRTEEQRQRAKKVGRRGIVAFILVDILIIAGLAWYFNYGSDPFDGAYDDGGEGDGTVRSFDADWSENFPGALVSNIEGTHNGTVESLAFLDAPNGPLLFSNGADGSIDLWDLTEGVLVDEYWPEDWDATDLWAAWGSDGEPIMIAIGADGRPYVWTTLTQEFEPAGTPEMVADGAEVAYFRPGTDGGTPVLTLVNDTEYEVYDLESQDTIAHNPIPDGYAYARFFTSADVDYTAIVAFDSEQRLDNIDMFGGVADGLPYSSEGWEGNIVEAFGIVYDWGSPHAMAYGSDNMLHFWDLEEQAESYAPTPYSDLGAEYHFEFVESVYGTALMSIDSEGVAQAVSLDTSDTVRFETSGVPTELVQVTIDDRQFAVTGDSEGNIRFWSLGN